MWILFRAFWILVAYVGHKVWRSAPGEAAVVGDQTVFVLARRHKGRVIGYTVGVPLKAEVWFRLYRETPLDHWFKRIGFATEIETRDKDFDDLVYIVCDHPKLSALLKRSAEARETITELLASGVTRIDHEGDLVRCSIKTEPSQPTLALVARLGKALAPLEKDSSRRSADPFLWKALIVEGVVWFLGGYGLFALLTQTIGANAQTDIHVSAIDAILPGLVLAAGLFVLLFSGVRLFMSGSSRGHRLIIESALMLALGLPPTGIQLFADLNRGLDRSSVEVQASVANCTTHVSRGRRGRRITTYRLHLKEPRQNTTMPSDIRVVPAICVSAIPGSSATVTLGKGAFGMPWYRRISIGGVSWTP